ncbi:MAG: hypothetical protein ACI9WU_005164 [Myxococcota bacterium]|jgi:uncharacterized protein YbaR (Trm112 family)
MSDASPIDADLLLILRCPVDKSTLSVASDAVLMRLNGAILDKKTAIQTVGGEDVEKPVEAGLVRADGAVLYPIQNSVPILIGPQGILLS